MSHMTVAGTTYQKLTADELPKRIAQATNNRVKLEVVPELIPPGEALSALKDKRVQGAMIVWPYFGGELPIGTIGQIPYLFNSVGEYHKATDALIKDAIGKELLSRYDAVQLTHGSWTAAAFFTNKPLRTVEDFKGLKARVYAYEVGKAVQAMGGSPVSIPWPEFYTAMQRGVVDAGFTGIASAAGLNVWDFTKYVNRWTFGVIPTWTIALTKDAWNTVPDDLKPAVQKAFDDLGQEAFLAAEQETKDVEKKFVEKGATIIDPDPQEQAKAKGIVFEESVNEWLQRNASKGIDAKDFMGKVRTMLNR
jgi:C4-dicarboxylate-binding protein DctP